MNSVQDKLTRAAIEQVLGRAPDALVTAILATGATLADVEVAEQWASGRNDVMGKTGHPLTGAAAAVYELLIADEPLDER